MIMKNLIKYLFYVLLLAVSSSCSKGGLEVEGLSFAQATVTVNVGRMFNLTLNARYGTSFKEYDLNANPAGVVLSSSDESVAKVDQSGTVTTFSVGTVKITALSKDGLKAVCTVRVSGDVADFTSGFSMSKIYLKSFIFPDDPNGTADNTRNAQLQNFDVDLKGNVYALGVSDPVSYVKKITPDGTEDAPMKFYYFGHGTGFSIEDTGSDVYIWISSFGRLGSINGHAGRYQEEQTVARVKYEAGKEYKPEDIKEHYYMGNVLHVWSYVDYEHDLLAVYHAGASGVAGKDGTVRVYNLQQAKQAQTRTVSLQTITRGGENGGPVKTQETLAPQVPVRDLSSLTPVYTFHTSYQELSGDSQQMQGICLNKDKFYWVAGRGFGTEKQPLTQVSTLDMRGNVLNKAQNLTFEDNKQDLIDAGISKDGTFEVEGMHIRDGHVYFGYNWNSTPNQTYTATCTIIKF